MRAECVYETIRFYETTAWNHFILYMHISLGGLFNISENGGGGGLYAPPVKLWRILCYLLNAFNYITIWQTVLWFCIESVLKV